ncbi:hypothetical protein ACR9E3_19130 [Actinomycetospora sp. C-140]
MSTAEGPADDVPADDVPAEDPPAEDPPAEDPPAEDATADDAPAYRPWQRFGISVLIVAILLSVLASVAPDSAIKTGLVGLTRPFILVTALDQRWGVFAPNPRLETSNVVARVERTDGTVGEYPLESAAGISEYWNYRWRKYGEQLWTDKTAEAERATFSRWVAAQDRAAGHQPVQVTLLRLSRPNLAPGPGPDEGPWTEIPFSTMQVSGR